MNACYLAGNAREIGYWSEAKNCRWVRALSHPGAAICITTSKLVLAKSLTTPGSRMIRAEIRWKNFLSLISRDDNATQACGEAVTVTGT